jgi:hypothetical protein
MRALRALHLRPYGCGGSSIRAEWRGCTGAEWRGCTGAEWRGCTGAECKLCNCTYRLSVEPLVAILAKHPPILVVPRDQRGATFVCVHCARVWTCNDHSDARCGAVRSYGHASRCRTQRRNAVFKAGMLRSNAGSIVTAGGHEGLSAPSSSLAARRPARPAAPTARFAG